MFIMFIMRETVCNAKRTIWKLISRNVRHEPYVYNVTFHYLDGLCQRSDCRFSVYGTSESGVLTYTLCAIGQNFLWKLLSPYVENRLAEYFILQLVGQSPSDRTITKRQLSF